MNLYPNKSPGLNPDRGEGGDNSNHSTAKYRRQPMHRMAILVAFAALTLSAQNNAPPASPTKAGSISGTVKDPVTGNPIEGITVSVFLNTRYSNGTVFMTSSSKELRETTDASGRYHLRDLPPSLYRISAFTEGHAVSREKSVNLREGQSLASVDFSLPTPATIAGRILDQNKEPVPGALVYLISQEYSLTGEIHFYVKNTTSADDQGSYVMGRVNPGIPYLVVATKSARRLSAISDAPELAKLRKASYVPTYFPNAAEPLAGSPLILRSGERREDVDIRLLRGPSFCISGAIESGGAPIAGQFTIAGQEFSTGIGRNGGVALVPLGGNVEADGKFRICDLRPGEYRVSAFFSTTQDRRAPGQFALAKLTVTDKDLSNVRLYAAPGLTVAGVIAWDGKPPDPPAAANATFSLRPLRRSIMMPGEAQAFARVQVPSDFRLENVWMDEYAATASVAIPGAYVKDIVYGNVSVLHEPLRLGSAQGEIRVLVARDGARLNTRVVDKDNNPVPYVNVVIAPLEANSEAHFAAALIVGETDQEGVFSSPVIAPGKYFVLTTSDTVDQTVDRIAKLWARRTEAKQVELAPGGSAELRIEQ